MPHDPPLVLTLDTSTQAITLALAVYPGDLWAQVSSATTVSSARACPAKILATRELDEPRGQTRLGVALITELLASTGLGYADLSAIVYVRGPGSFTGIRAGCAMVAGFSVANPLLSVYGVSAFDVLGEALWQQEPASRAGPLAILLDTKRQDYYFYGGAATRAGQMQTSTLARCATQEDVILFLGEHPTSFLVGQAWELFFQRCREDVSPAATGGGDCLRIMEMPTMNDKSALLSLPSAALVTQIWPALYHQGAYHRGVDPLYMRPAYVYER